MASHALRIALDRRRRAGALGGDSVPAWVLRGGGLKATLDVDFVNDRAWNANGLVSVASLLACARAETKFVPTSSGSLSLIAINALPYTNIGLYPEGASENFILQSQTLGTTWSTTGVSVSSNAAVAPDGTTTADKLIPGASDAVQRVYQVNFPIDRLLTLGTGSTNVATMTVYATPSGYNFIRLAVFDAGFSNGAWANFNLLTGAVTGTNGLTGTGVLTAATIEAAGLGYFRCRLTCTFPAVTTEACGEICVDNVDQTRGTSWTGDGTSGVTLWGAQFEPAVAPSSYIPTTTASAQRHADIITFSDLTWFDGAAQTIYAEWIARNTNNATVWAFDATNDKLLDEQTGMSARIAGATVGNTVAAGGVSKVAARMALNDFALAMNGGTVAADTSETAPGTLGASRLGVDLSGANSLNSPIRRVSAFKSSLLNDAALQALGT